LATAPPAAAGSNPTKRPYTKHKRRHIPLPNGDELVPREELANEVFGVCERTAANHGWPTVYISNVAYCPRGKVLTIEASRVRYAPEPRDTKRGRRR
jgi:hypothetical protein